MNIAIVSLILVITLFLLIWEKLRIDLTAIGILVALMITGILSPIEAVSGFSSPAVITVGAMFLISRGMTRTGAVELVGKKVIRLCRGNLRLTLMVILLIVSIASAFINNTPVVVLFIPVVMGMCCEFQLSPSKFLIPVSYASVLAGTCTLIGTSTNLIISNLSEAKGYGALGMFELSAVGIPIAVIGLLFLFFASPYLMPSLLNPTCEIENSEHRRYLAELSIPRGSKWIDMNPEIAFKEAFPNLEAHELIRYSHIYFPGRDNVKMAAGDLLLVKGSANDLIDILQDKEMQIPLEEKGLDFSGRDVESLIVELLIPPQSALLGKRLSDTEIYRDPEIHLMAIKRSGLHYTENKIHDIQLKIGDILLIWCPSKRLDTLRGGPDLIVVDDVHHEIIHKKKARIAFSIFAGLILAASFGLADIMVCALTAAFLMILTGCIQIRDGYRALQGDVLMLIVGTIALGLAIEKTGASQLYANGFLGMFSGLSPIFTLGGIIILTSISTHLLSNNATAVLVLPIAVSTAVGLGLNPKPFIMGVCFGASACYATPIGYQTNLLVYGPGGYRFIDYLKLGIPVNLIVCTLSLILIPHFWPF